MSLPIYEFTAPVVKGNGLGHSLGAPTLNQPLPDGEVSRTLPFGVYFSRCKIGDKSYPAVSNLGVKPTISDGKPADIAVESYLFGYDGDAYGQNVTTALLYFRRREMKFPDKEALSAAISKDADAAMEYFGIKDGDMGGQK